MLYDMNGMVLHDETRFYLIQFEVSLKWYRVTLDMIRCNKM